MEIKTYNLTDYINITDVHFDENGYPIPYKGVISEMKINNRPMTESGDPQIYIDYKNEKLVVHNYGHCAQGWTIAFGSILNAIELFENSLKEKSVNLNEFKNTQNITVIGFGVIGLNTALLLNLKGYKNINLIGEQKDLITSHIAGGGFNTVPLQQINDENLKGKLNNMVLNSFLIYKSIVEGNHPFSEFLRDCVEWMDYITVTPDGQGVGLKNLADLNLIPQAVPVKILYGSKENPKFMINKHWMYRTFVIHTEKYCLKAFNKIKDLGIKCELKKINSFSEINANYIFNCTGLGSKVLNNDKKVFPCAGHGIILKNQNIDMKSERPQVCFSSISIPEMENSPNKGSIYLYPKDNSIFLGGTSIMNYDGSDDKKNREEWRKLVIRARALFHGLNENQIIKPKF